MKVTRDNRADVRMFAICDILYWLVANNPPQRGPLYWTQIQWDECNELRDWLKHEAAKRTPGKRFP
jgi:hypothetical protein